MVKRYTSNSARPKEGGLLATHKQDFVSHTGGDDFRHSTSHIDVESPLVGSSLQAFLEVISAPTGLQGFVTVGDGYNESTDISGAIQYELSNNTRLSGGGFLVIKSGRYAFQNQVIVPNGVTILGEGPGVALIGEMNNESMFHVASPTGLISAEDRVQFINITLYDNFNDTILGGGASMNTFGGQPVPMISLNKGNFVTISNCGFCGKANSVTDVTSRCVRVVNSSVDTYLNGTILRFTNNNVKDIRCAVEFFGDLGTGDSLFISENKLSTLSGNVPFTAESAAVAFENCNAIIVNNNHTGNGSGSPWSARSFIYFISGANDSAFTEITITGNTGELVGVAGAYEYYQGTMFTNTKYNVSNAWGPNLTNNYTSYNDFPFYYSQEATFRKDLVVGGKVSKSRHIIDSSTYIIDDSDFGTTISIDTSRVFLDCRSVTEIGNIGLQLGYTPDDGEELFIIIVNHATLSPTITRIDFDPSMFFIGSSMTDYHTPDPRPGGVTTYKFIYNGITSSFDFLSKTVSETSPSNIMYHASQKIGLSSPIFDNLYSTECQKSFSVVQSISMPGKTKYNDITASVFSIDINKCMYSAVLGCVIAFGVLNADEKLFYSDNGSDWLFADLPGTFPFASSLSVIYDFFGTTSASLLVGSVATDDIYRVSLSRLSGGSISATSNSTWTATGTTNGFLVQGPNSGRILMYGGGGIKTTESASSFTSLVNQYLNTQVIVDMSRSPDGRIMAINATGDVWLHTPPSAGDFTSTLNFVSLGATGLSSQTNFVSYNRLYDCWLIYDSPNDRMYISSDNGASWSISYTFSSFNSATSLQMVGNSNIITFSGSSGSGKSGLLYTNNPTQSFSWRPIMVRDDNDNTIGFKNVGWVNNKLIAIRERTTSYTGDISSLSTENTEAFSMLDFDK